MKICFDGTEFPLEVYHSDPSTKTSSRQSEASTLLDKVLFHCFQCNFKSQHSLQKSIDLLNNMVLDLDLESMEKTHQLYTTSSDLNFRTMMEIIENDNHTPVNSSTKQKVQMDQAFVLSSDKRRALFDSSDKKGAKVNNPVSSKGLESCTNEIGEKSDEEDYLPIRKKSTLFFEDSSNKRSERAIHSNPAQSSQESGTLKKLHRLKQEKREENKKHRVSTSINQVGTIEEDNITCPICYSRFT